MSSTLGGTSIDANSLIVAGKTSTTGDVVHFPDRGLAPMLGEPVEYVETIEQSFPALSQAVGNAKLDSFALRALCATYRLVRYSRGLDGDQMVFKNGGGAPRKEQAAVQITGLLSSDITAEGHFRGPQEANRYVHHRVDRFINEASATFLVGESDSECNSRLYRDAAGLNYRRWDMTGELRVFSVLRCKRYLFGRYYTVVSSLSNGGSSNHVRLNCMLHSTRRTPLAASFKPLFALCWNRNNRRCGSAYPKAPSTSPC